MQEAPLSRENLVRLAIAAGAAVLTHLWSRFRSRLAVLSWSAESSKIASSVEEQRFGKISVLYNDQPVDGIFLTTLTLRNESNSDIAGLKVFLELRSPGHILLTSGSVNGAPNAALIPPEYFKKWEQAAGTPALEYYYRIREYDLPVFNRGAVATFEIMASHSPQQEPVAHLTCNHIGVVLKNRPPVPMVHGVSLASAIWVGLVCTVGITAGLVVAGLRPWIVALVAWLLGAAAQLVGAIVVRSLRAVVRALS